MCFLFLPDNHHQLDRKVPPSKVFHPIRDHPQHNRHHQRRIPTCLSGGPISASSNRQQTAQSTESVTTPRRLLRLASVPVDGTRDQNNPESTEVDYLHHESQRSLNISRSVRL